MDAYTKENEYSRADSQVALVENRPQRCSCRNRKVPVFVLIPLGIVFIVTGVFFPIIYEDSVKQKLVLTKGSEAYKSWYTPPSPVYMTYHVFNYTNINDIIENKATPHVSQIGPFTYREIRINQVLDYNEYNITYVQNYSYVLDPSKSCPTCRESDFVFVPSISLLSLLHSIGEKTDIPWLAKSTINEFLRLEKLQLFQKVTIYQSIWGYEDRLLKLIRRFKDIIEMAGMKVPSSPIIALQHNGTDGADDIGNITLLTGKENINDVQRIVRWRGLDNAPYWLTKYGRMINGTDGTHTPPFLKKDYRWYVFVTNVCRSLYFVYKEDETFLDIPLYRFSTNEKLFMNSSANPDNIAFCSNKHTCWGSGLLPISKCQAGGPPIFMSSPHFYQGDPILVKRIKGLHPDAALHASNIDVEPITGITMRAYKRLQINVMAQKTLWLEASYPLQYKYNFFPMLMIEEVAVIDPTSAAKFRKMVLTPKSILSYGHYILIVVGSTMVLVGSILIIMLILKHRLSKYGAPAKNTHVPKTEGEEAHIHS